MQSKRPLHLTDDMTLRKPFPFTTRAPRFFNGVSLTIFYFLVTAAGLGLAASVVYGLAIYVVEAIGHTLALQGAGVLLAGGLLVLCWCAALACRED